MNTDILYKNPFELSPTEFQQWLQADETNRKQIAMVLNKCIYKGHVIPTKWKKDTNSFYLVTQSAKRENTIQLTLFINNIPTFDMLRSDFKDIIEELHYNNATIEQINYIN